MKYFGVLRLCSGFCAQKQAVRTPHLTGCRGLVQIRTSESPLCHIFATNRPSTWLILSERIRVYADFRLTHDGANDSATTATASGLFILRIPWLVDGPGTVSASGCCRDSHHVACRAFGIASVPILATVNPTLRANIGIEIKIMTTGTSIEAHTTAPAVNTASR